MVPGIRANKILKILKKTYPKAKTALDFNTPLEILVATILSAQCTDKRVNMVTKTLFKKYKNVKDYANIKQAEFEKDIRTTGFYKNKSKNIIAAANMIIKDYKGKVPRLMKDLIKLPGVARKTANIVQQSAYNITEGIAVDTHVRRLSQRLKFTKYNDPKKIEIDLMNIFPKKYWNKVSYVLVSHGRNTCIARKPKCSECNISAMCPSRQMRML